jgi:putative membrane protein
VPDPDAVEIVGESPVPLPAVPQERHPGRLKTSAIQRYLRGPGARSWKPALMRFAVSAVALLVILVLPGYALQDNTFVSFVIVAAIFGALNALVKPLLQFFAVPFILDTFGVTMILTNMLLIWLLDLFAGGLIEIDRFGAYVVGAVLVGVITFLLEGILGVTPPIIPDEPAPERGAG